MSPALAFVGALAVLVCGVVSAGCAYIAAGCIILDRGHRPSVKWMAMSAVYCLAAGVIGFALGVAR